MVYILAVRYARGVERWGTHTKRTGVLIGDLEKNP